MYFDTHAHLCDEKFNEDRAELIQSLPGSGLSHVIDVCCSCEFFEMTKKTCEQFPFVLAAYGVHPHEAGEMSDDDLLTVEKWLKNSECVALGEIGLDYHYDFCPREIQKKRFAQQMEIAAASGKPVIIHDREAHRDTLDILRAFKGKVHGVMHCYSGSAEMVRDYVALDYYISFAGAVTFANASKPQLAAAAVPDSRILIETDCPYLTPVPNRGKRNDPSHIHNTAKKIAELRRSDLDDFAALTLSNAKTLFSIG